MTTVEQIQQREIEEMQEETFIAWLRSEKSVYLKKGKWIAYGDADDTTEAFEKEHQWEFSRNRMIDKSIAYLKYEQSHSAT